MFPDIYPGYIPFLNLSMVFTKDGTSSCCQDRESIRETLTYAALPRKLWKSIRTDTPMERIIREIYSWIRL